MRKEYVNLDKMETIDIFKFTLLLSTIKIHFQNPSSKKNICYLKYWIEIWMSENVQIIN